MCRRGNHLLLGIRQPKQNIPSHLPWSLEDIMLPVQFISTQNVWLHLIKMLTMSGDHWWLILHVPETVLVDNNLHCFKPIQTHCNSFAGNVSRMWLNIHSAWAQDLGQLAEAWWMTSIWRSNRKVVINNAFSFCDSYYKKLWIFKMDCLTAPCHYLPCWQWSPMIFIWGQFHRRYFNQQSLSLVLKLLI